MVDSLKTSSLLLNSGEDNGTKVHDIIRGVARSIAFTDSNYAFLQVTCNSHYLPSSASYCSRKFLRLDAETADVHFNEDLECPDLHTLWLQSNNHPQKFSGGFFRMFVNLSSLMLESVTISLQQFSLQPLGNLGTLSLFKCDIRKTDVSLFPKNLKSLWIFECDLPRPLDVANLKHLRKLEIHHIKTELAMVPNAISSLSSLEELHIPYGFVNDHYQEYHVQPIVMEISQLNRLKSLQFQFYEDTKFQGTDILFPNIDRYSLSVGISRYGNNEREWGVPSMRMRRSIELYGKQWKSWEGLMARAEKLRLQSSDIELSSICNGHRRAFQDLKELYIRDCHNIGYSLQHVGAGFSQLTILNIGECSTF
nr:disease resistance protein [Anethum foeniculum]